MRVHESTRRNNRHRKRYEEEARRAERAPVRRLRESEDDKEVDGTEKGEEQEGDARWEDGEDDVEELRLEDLVKVKVVKARRRESESSPSSCREIRI